VVAIAFDPVDVATQLVLTEHQPLDVLTAFEVVAGDIKGDQPVVAAGPVEEMTAVAGTYVEERLVTTEAQEFAVDCLDATLPASRTVWILV
jgi:hypothetical protein